MPHYWAPYYHDGRGVVRPLGRRKFLIWFRDPLKNDPRLAGRYPIFKGQTRRLTKQEFAQGLAANRRNPTNPVMFLATRSPGYPRRRAKKNPFIERSFNKFDQNPIDIMAVSQEAVDLVTAYTDRKTTAFRAQASEFRYVLTKRRSIKMGLGRIF